MATWLLPAIAVAAILAWLDRAFGRDRRANRQRLRGSSRLIETRRGPIEYVKAGSGPAVLVIHGAGAGFDQGMEFAEPIAKTGFRVVAMSRFGYLRTADAGRRNIRSAGGSTSCPDGCARDRSSGRTGRLGRGRRRQCNSLCAIPTAAKL
jgi:hypothetical protein